MVLHAQNNLPVDMMFVQGGAYCIQTYDSITNMTKTYPSHDIPSFYMSNTEVSVQDFKQFCKETKKHELPFLLPTRQQWEYAARAGNFDTPDFMNNQELPSPYVVYIGNSKEKPECISCMQPNELGLYALCGNVWEWVLAEPRDQGQATVVGGSFFESADQVRINSSRRYSKYLRRQDIGFRVVINPD